MKCDVCERISSRALDSFGRDHRSLSGRSRLTGPRALMKLCSCRTRRCLIENVSKLLVHLESVGQAGSVLDQRWDHDQDSALFSARLHASQTSLVSSRCFLQPGLRRVMRHEPRLRLDPLAVHLDPAWQREEVFLVRPQMRLQLGTWRPIHYRLRDLLVACSGLQHGVVAVRRVVVKLSIGGDGWGVKWGARFGSENHVSSPASFRISSQCPFTIHCQIPGIA